MKNVFNDERRGGWFAKIRVGRTTKRFGPFPDVFTAARVNEAAGLYYHGERFACGNPEFFQELDVLMHNAESELEPTPEWSSEIEPMETSLWRQLF
jgi:hypothetical protein